MDLIKIIYNKNNYFPFTVKVYYYSWTYNNMWLQTDMTLEDTRLFLENECMLLYYFHIEKVMDICDEVTD